HPTILRPESVRGTNCLRLRTLLPGLTLLMQAYFSTSQGLRSMRMARPEPITPPTDSGWIHCRMRVIEEIGGRSSQTTRRESEIQSSKVSLTQLQGILFPLQPCMTAPIPIPETLADMSMQRKFLMLCFTQGRFVMQSSATLQR